MLPERFLVDWLAEKVISLWSVPFVQFGLVWVALAPFYSAKEGVQRTLRLGLGLCAGRIVGRALGALFLGEEGPILLEPISEMVMALWLLPASNAHEPDPASTEAEESCSPFSDHES